MFSYPGAQISDPRSGFFLSWIRIPDPGFKKHRIPDPGYGSATLAPPSTHCQLIKAKPPLATQKEKKWIMRFLEEWPLQSCKLAEVCMQTQLILTTIKQSGLL
jgi:hypothetical protein